MTAKIDFSNWDGIAQAARNAMVGLIPPEDLKPSEWAEKNVQIPVGNAKPGPIRFANAPYQRGMIDVIKEPGIQRVAYQTGAQLGKTTIQQCITGYFIDHEPRSQMFVQPTQGDVQTFLETKLRPMLAANPKINNKMAKQRGRHGVNNSRLISYIGGWLMFSWAGSPKTLRGRSAPVTQADETDGMVPLPEGDPLELLAQRAASFGDDALRTESSTPTIKGASRIETAYELGDQRRYYVPCPHCQHQQYLRWKNVTWNGRVSTDVEEWEKDADKGIEHDHLSAGYMCEECGVVWTDGERILAIREAENNGGGWKAAKPFTGHASFHAPEMLSTFRMMKDIVKSYLNKIALGDMQSFVNVSLGETWDEQGDKVDPDILMARREEYAASVPMGGLYLTAGVDMQIDRLECEIVAWGVGEESWSVAYHVLWGDPLTPDPWDALDDLLAETYQHESGAVLPISAACLDTGGTSGYTQAAYDYAKGRTGRKLFAIKGVGGWGRAIVEKPQRKQSGKNARKVDLFLVGTDEAKLVTARRLNTLIPGPGYCHFPADRDEEWFKQITAEKLVVRYIKGQPVREWTKPDKARNEALDCRNYAYAALKIMQPSLKHIASRLGVDTENFRSEKRAPLPSAKVIPKREKPREKPEDSPHEEKEAPTRNNRTIKRSAKLSPRRRGGFVNNW